MFYDDIYETISIDDDDEVGTSSSSSLTDDDSLPTVVDYSPPQPSVIFANTPTLRGGVRDLRALNQHYIKQLETTLHQCINSVEPWTRAVRTRIFEHSRLCAKALSVYNHSVFADLETLCLHSNAANDFFALPRTLNFSSFRRIYLRHAISHILRRFDILEDPNLYIFVQKFCHIMITTW